MLKEDAMQTRERIISLLRINGPSLPVHIAKGTGLSILFASAFLSELFYEKEISISNIKVGSSPLYFLPGQEPQLERFSHYLKSKEKEAFLLLKENKFLKDSEQQPAIRVALREIKDFAIAFKIGEEIYWRYFIIPEEEFDKKEKPALIEVKKELEVIPEEKQEEEKSEEDKLGDEGEGVKEELNIFEEKPQKTERKRTTRKRNSKKQDEQFFNKVKEFLSEKNIEIIDIQSFNKNDLALKVKEEKEEKLLIAYNKKKITSADLIKAYKKSLEANLPYIILSLGEPAKNLKELISAIKELSKIDRIE